MTVVTLPTTIATITNWAFVGRAEADGYEANNRASSVTAVVTPALSVSDVAVVEGTAG